MDLITKTYKLQMSVFKISRLNKTILAALWMLLYTIIKKVMIRTSMDRTQSGVSQYSRVWDSIPNHQATPTYLYRLVCYAMTQPFSTSQVPKTKSFSSLKTALISEKASGKNFLQKVDLVWDIIMPRSTWAEIWTDKNTSGKQII